ncbi:bifunctional phosphoribosylaminoimidazolecarboxamide formyltransferase/IMP cyclohydrolase [Sedimentibacter sp. MB31-C6]|uniref:bifunctional phosphoribosylaminoimidazolecarboxamide formyltransferase/IMP cyclohydrolase n=1 Tax=Sedimentibacter sp. MB31-C6 TaxID=3109366 RepID=UPI002DDD803C|nr:bifunctional phosphoribosylaminoimidazolecarboxamide formyltransferase/IMP cyclohydrolase [Sedimentibacter sp. MB36-C1]WSI03994.1 bifunctional phosphoribosylaminoimidazolecarboxamide formyltransferase/IMP cyclohydrolase [Sedimentibacter sp. MB36-C1]
MRALISVSDKTGIVEFAKKLIELGVEIISTGGTKKVLEDADVKVSGISDITGFPECLDGRVKTLHPNIHAGLLAMRSNSEHMQQLKDLNIETIDIVVVNLYPFKETILKDSVTREIAIENIDIGGPTMLRAAAKNYQDVAVVVDPKDYSVIVEELEHSKEVSLGTKFSLCLKVFEHTSHYDTLIANYIKKENNDNNLPETFTMTYEKVQDMRYGENPHQKAAFYKEVIRDKGLLTSAEQLHGKELSFNNINDTNGALELLKEFEEPTVVACKHSNPCGVGTADNIYGAYIKAYQADPTSIYGGIVVSNREIDEKTAEEINKIFLEIVVAPSYSAKAIEILKSKKNIRILKLRNIMQKQDENDYDLKKVAGGILVQTIDNKLLEEDNQLKKVTKREPSEQEMKDLIMAWKIVKHTKSNAITIVKNGQSIGIGPGQVNRIWSCKQAIEHAEEFLGKDSLKGACLGSDAYFPFSDSVETAAEAGVTAIIQPGGSIRDKDSIEACDKYNISMLFTNMRHFKH